ncbi:ankyrin repeat-containing domain protein [Aspergillus californicus]
MPYEAFADELPEQINSETTRYFGWYAGELPQTGVSKLFGTFFKSILDIAEDVGGIDISEAPHFRLSNLPVTEIAEAFVENALGPINDALLCILPTILARLEVPPSKAALTAAKNSANQHRRRRDWNKVKEVLKWAWSEIQEFALIALGELSRWALRDAEAGTFGTDGIDWILSEPPAKASQIPQGWQQSQPVTKNSEKQQRRKTTIRTGVSGNRLKPNDLTSTLVYLTRRFSTLTQEERGEALCLVAKRAWSEVLLALIELGTEIDYKDSNALTALSHAAIKGNTEIVSFLMDAGASLNSVDKAERTALSYASEMGHEPIVRKFLNDPRTFPDIKDNARRTPLSLAAEMGHEAVV